MTFVLDTSVAGAWYLPDEQSEYATRVLDRLRLEGAAAPDLWALEMANILAVAERRRRITAAERAEAIRTILYLPIEMRSIAFTSVLERVLALALTHGLTTYDAAYLDLAMREGLPLATQDGALRAAALRAGVELVA